MQLINIIEVFWTMRTNLFSAFCCLLPMLGLYSEIVIGEENVVSEQVTRAPACIDPHYQDFDFFVGEWDVRDADDKLVGTNSIVKILNGCAVSENWLSVGNNAGVSYNFYDSALDRWHQTWVDASGGVLYLEGGLVDGSMVLSGERPAKNNLTTYHRITYTPLEDGRVKQHWQGSRNQGKTWDDVFLGFYSKKQP